MAANISNPPSRRCGAGDASPTRTLPLPVLETSHDPRGRIRPSKSGRRRAIVLATVQLLLIAHIVQWWITGRTTTPIEPSESMEFVKDGVVNVGLIFFALALLSTLVLGRWFCGWGCHIVMLQDLCGWMMKKLGVRPKPFRSRLLIYVPLLLALYMFIWPAVFRWGVVPLDRSIAAGLGDDHWLVSGVRTMFAFGGIQLSGGELPRWGVTWELTTDGFWDTFAGPLVAIPTLFVCGFATVYFLGAKGFCTYGCPYGGFFAPLDEFAPARIRVTDACEHCGHCTAVCTSNVRVHEEVREYGMVVDPGCMKCLDCVSVCPNDALYFGFGKPAAWKGPAKNQTPKKIHDLTWPEEIGLAVVFAATFFGVRGLYGGTVPMLFAVGIAGCVAFLAWKLWQIIRRENVSVLRTRLKYKGAMQAPGWVWAAAATGALLLTAHSGLVNLAGGLGAFYERRVDVPLEAVFSPGGVDVNEQTRGRAERAIRYYSFGSWIGSGGIGLLPAGQTDLDVRRAWLLAVLGRLDEADDVLDEAISRVGDDEQLCRHVGRVRWARESPQPAMDWYRAVLLEHETHYLVLADCLAWAPSVGQVEAADALCRDRLERWPDDIPTILGLVNLHLAAGRLEVAITLAGDAVERHPDEVDLRRAFAQALVLDDRNIEALDQMRRVIELAPDSAADYQRTALLLHSMGQPDEAHRMAEKAMQLDAAHRALRRH